MWRKPSKFKNTTPVPPKREDLINDIPIGSLSCTSNGVKASNSFLTFYIDGDGGKLGVLPVDAKGRKTRQDLSIVCAHADRVADFDFAPFHEDLLATCSVRDEPVKLWKLDVNHNIPSSFDVPVANIPITDAPAECLSFHSTADNLLTVGAGLSVFLLDVERHRVALSLTDFNERIQNISWKADGKLLAALDRGREAKIFDPRSSGTNAIARATTHDGTGREAKLLWLSEAGQLLTSGFTKRRNREVLLFDERNFHNPIRRWEFEASTGILIPLYDPDTRLLWLAGKGSCKILMMESTDKDPYLADALPFTCDCQTLGACLVPKTALSVMQGEVARLIQLSGQRLTPISYVVPRKSYRDFHEDIFPDTIGHIPGNDISEWLNGESKLPPKLSLNPSKHRKPNILIDPRDNEKKVDTGLRHSSEIKSTDMTDNGNVLRHSSNGTNLIVTEQNVQATPTKSTTTDASRLSVANAVNIFKSQDSDNEKIIPAIRSDQKITRVSQSFRETTSGEVKMRSQPRPQNSSFRTSMFTGLKTSKYRHVVVTSGGKEGTFINLRKVNTRLPQESNGFCINERWMAIPMLTAGGLVAIFDITKPMKIADGVIPGLENGAGITDMVWCPFNADCFVTACDNGLVNFWDIPKEGVKEILSTPSKVLQAHNDKINVIRFNPFANDVLASAASNGSVIVWNTDTLEAIISLEGHSQPILSMAWSADGKLLSTISRDCLLRLYNPRMSAHPLKEANCLQTPKGARVLFVCKDQFILVSSFSKSSERVISLYDANDLSLVHSQVLDNSPSLLIPHYDYDSSVLFLTGKGDRSIHMFEVCGESPYFLQLSTYTGAAGHQAIGFAPKISCNVRKVEFARGARLTLTDIELMSFTVPRVKMNFFQNDLFPPSLMSWEPVCSAQQWFEGEEPQQRFMSLKPDDMELLYNQIDNSGSSSARNSTSSATGRLKSASSEELREDAENRTSDKPEPKTTCEVLRKISNGDLTAPKHDQSPDTKKCLVNSLMHNGSALIAHLPEEKSGLTDETDSSWE